MGLDDCCAGSCSALDSSGCNLLSHADIDKMFRKSLGLRERYSLFMMDLSNEHPNVYGALRFLRLNREY